MYCRSAIYMGSLDNQGGLETAYLGVYDVCEIPVVFDGFGFFEARLICLLLGRRGSWYTMLFPRSVQHERKIERTYACHFSKWAYSCEMVKLLRITLKVASRLRCRQVVASQLSAKRGLSYGTSPLTEHLSSYKFTPILTKQTICIYDMARYQ